MPINVIVNDPRPGEPPLIATTRALRNHFAMKVRFERDYPQREYDPATHPEAFLHWQCRQSALLALHAWKNAVAGRVSLMTWYGGKPELLIRENVGVALNAYYDRRCLSFFRFATGGKSTFSGLSTDVVAHEVGHHVQTLLGISTKVQQAKRGLSEVAANRLTVQQELQADCFAGIWGHHASRSRQLLEGGDIEEGLNAASAIGDDRLQKQSRGYVTPESFTHGSSAQRVRWFKLGLEKGSMQACNSFASGAL